MKRVELKYAQTTTDSTTAFLGAFAKLRKVTFSFAMSVRLSSWNNSAPTGRIFKKKYETCRENVCFIQIGKA